MEGFWWGLRNSFDMIYLCRQAVHFWDCMQDKHFGFQLVLLKSFEIASVAIGTFIFAFGGVIIGGIAGALKGQTTETGMCRGAAIGVISGAIVALELLDSVLNGHFLSKVALFGSIFNGKAFREWVSPAVLKAYQWQTSMSEVLESPRSDIYSVDETRGMTIELIKNLPVIDFLGHSSGFEACCSVCLQDFVENESVRKLKRCEHLFHQLCVDEWLVRSASCPVCRTTVD